MEKLTVEKWNNFSEIEKSNFAVAWNKLNTRQRESIRCNEKLNESLLPFKGCRISAISPHGENVRFWVGQSTGWVPCTLAIKTTRSYGGDPVDTGAYSNIKVIKYSR